MKQVGAFLAVPVQGQLQLGEQDIFLCEHRDAGGWGGGHKRKIVITVRDAQHKRGWRFIVGCELRHVMGLAVALAVVQWR